MGPRSLRRARWRVEGGAALVVAATVLGALFAVPAACGWTGSAGEEGSDAEGAGWIRRAAADRPVSTGSLAIEPGVTGRYVLRLERGVEGEVVVDTEVRGTFDRSVPSWEIELDLWELSAPAIEAGLATWPEGAPHEMVVRRIGDDVYLDTGRAPYTWVRYAVDDPGVAPFLATLPVDEPDRLLGELTDGARDVRTHDGGVVDGVETVRYSGRLDLGAVSRAADEGWSAADRTAIRGVGLEEVLGSMLRFDLWVGTGDGLARRLVVELDHEALAALARRLDGTDAEVRRLRHRTEVEWFDLGAPVVIEAPPPGLVGVFDLGSTRP